MNEQIEALKMAIAEIEGWIDHAYGYSPEDCADNKAIQACKNALVNAEKQEWQSLSDGEMKIIQNNSWIIHDDGSKEFNTFVFARAIEAKIKEKNQCLKAPPIHRFE